MIQGLRVSIRNPAKSPGYALAAILTRALGIAGNAAIFSLVYSVMLKPLAYREPDRLMVISEFLPKFSHLYPTIPVSAGHYVRIRDEVKSFEAVAALDEGNGSMAVTGSGEPERLGMARMTHQLDARMGRSAGGRGGRAGTVAAAGWCAVWGEYGGAMRVCGCGVDPRDHRGTGLLLARAASLASLADGRVAIRMMAATRLRYADRESRNPKRSDTPPGLVRARC